MHDDLRARQERREAPDAPGMVQVHVRQDDVIDRRRVEADLAERRRERRRRERRTGIDECGAALIDDQMARIELFAHIVRVDRIDALADGFQSGDHSARRQTATVTFGRMIGENHAVIILAAWEHRNDETENFRSLGLGVLILRAERGRGRRRSHAARHRPRHRRICPVRR